MATHGIVDSTDAPLAASVSTARRKTRRRRPRRQPPLPRPEDFPARYGQTFIELIDVSARVLFAFWEVDPIDLERVQRHAPDARWMVIRVHDVTYIAFDGGNAHSSFDLDVHGMINNWYIHPWAQGRSFIADLGMRDASGRFHVLARSNCVQTPRDDEAFDGEEKWMQVDGDPRRGRLIGEQYAFRPPLGEAQAAVPVSGLKDLEPVEVMHTIKREEIVGFYAALFRNCAAGG